MKDHGIKIGLGSASKNAKIILQKLQLMDYFEVIIDGNIVIKGKPDPEVFLKGCNALNVPNDRCIVFEDQFDIKSLERHFDFYEPFTVHESSLSPCVHSILAAKLDKMELAYYFYSQTSRLDLDDYNNEVDECLHITSMAGTWTSIVEGFGGVRVKNNELHINPKLPLQWKEYSFKINFGGTLIKVKKTKNGTKIKHDNIELNVFCEDKII